MSQCRDWEALVYSNHTSFTIRATKADFAFAWDLFQRVLPAHILPKHICLAGFGNSSFLASWPPPHLDFWVFPLTTSSVPTDFYVLTSVNHVTSPTTALFSWFQPTLGINLLLPMTLVYDSKEIWLFYMHFIHLMLKCGGKG